MAFVLVTPFVLSRRLEVLWAKRLFFPLGAVVGLTAYAMSVYAVGGWVERSAVLFFNTLFLISLARAYGSMRSGEGVEEMRWTLRAVAVLLGIATTRPVMGVFFATSRLTHFSPANSLVSHSGSALRSTRSRLNCGYAEATKSESQDSACMEGT